jgi:excisionase family DNA binding protein
LTRPRSETRASMIGAGRASAALARIPLPRPTRSHGNGRPAARAAAAILRIGRNQLYQAIARGELGAVRIGRSIRIPKQAMLDLLTVTSPPAAGPPTAHGEE